MTVLRHVLCAMLAVAVLLLFILMVEPHPLVSFVVGVLLGGGCVNLAFAWDDRARRQSARRSFFGEG